MNDQLTIMLGEAIDGGLTEVELREAASNAENEITKARDVLSAAEQAIEDNQRSIQVRQQRADTMAAETSKRRTSYNRKFFTGTYKSSVAEEGALRVQEDAQYAILLDSVRYGELLIEDLHRAKRAATLRLLESQQKWLRAQGLVECAISYRLFSEVLRNDQNAKLDLKGTKCDSYAQKFVEFENLIQQFHQKEVMYGNQK